MPISQQTWRCNKEAIVDIPKLTESDKAKTIGNITKEECLRALKKLPNGKTPGLDGITTDFYKFFWTDISLAVLESINYAFDKGMMSNDQRTGIITLSPKKDKCRLSLKNWRPITLLTIDYKIIAKSLALRLEDILPHYIDETQFGYVKDRYIGENIRCVVDINNLCKINGIEAIALQIDFQKAFDSIGWNFMLNTLIQMNFSDDYVKWVKILYTDIQAMVSNNGNLTDRFEIGRGVHQGCPLSALLFIILVQVLSHMLNKRKDIKGLKIGNTDIKILQMADDTTIFASGKEEVGKILSLLKAFYKISGLKTNVEKTIAYTLGPNSLKNTKEFTNGLKWQTLPIKLLGVTITDDPEHTDEINIKSRAESIKTLTHIWSSRNISLKGKVTIINSLLIPKIIYPATILGINDKSIKDIDITLTKFLWSWKHPKIKKDILVREHRHGGIKLPCLKCKTEAWRTLWAIRCIKYENPTPLWVKLVNCYLPGKVTLPILLRSRPKEEYIKHNFPNLPKFYVDIISTWTKARNNEQLDSKESIMEESLWLNQNLSVKDVPLYNPDCINRGLHSVKDIMDDSGNLKNINAINASYNTKLNFLDYLKIRLTIPQTWKKTLTRPCPIAITRKAINATLISRITTIKTKDIYWEILQRHHDLESVVPGGAFWANKYDISTEEMEKVYMLPHCTTKNTALQALQYKIINRIINCNQWLHKLKIKNTPKCRFCNKDETLEHYFFACQITKQFWRAFFTWWNTLPVLNLHTLEERDVILGIPLSQETAGSLNYCILIAKLSIYQNKSVNLQPDIYKFHCELKDKLIIEEAISLKNDNITRFTNTWKFITDNF